MFGEFSSSRDDQVFIGVDEFKHKTEQMDAIKDAITAEAYNSHGKGSNRDLNKTSTGSSQARSSGPLPAWAVSVYHRHSVPGHRRHYL